MSWDVVVFAFENPPPPMDKWPDDFRPPPMGEAKQVRDQITRSLPKIDWSDPGWGRLREGDYSIEFNFQEDGIVEGFMLHVRGGGDPLTPICKLCLENGWYALDCSTGNVIDLDAPSQEGWQGFQSYRDKIIGKLSEGPDQKSE
jgi:hypothetical protein